MAVIQRGSVVKNTCLWHVVAIAGNKGCSGVGAAGTGSTGRDVSRIGNDRRNAAKAIGGESVTTADGTGTEVGVERVVVLGDVSITAAQGKAAAHALFERKNASVVRAAIPRTKPVDLHEAATTVGDASRKGKIGFSNSEDVDDVFVVVVHGENPIVAELALNTKSVAARVGSGETRINCHRKISWLEDIERERAERPPKPETGRHAGGGIRRGEERTGTQAGELLNVALVDDDIGRYRRRANMIQMIYSVIGGSRRVKGIRARLTGNLRVSLRR